MKRLLFAMMLLMLPLAAQEKTEERAAPPKRVQKLFVLKYSDPRTVADLLRVFDAQTIYNSEMHTLAITAMPDTMQAIGDAIARLDTPAAAPKNIDLTMQLVLGTDADGAAGSLPRDLEPVVTQLRNSFPFKNYRLLDVLVLRSRTGQRAGTESSGGSMTFSGSGVSKSVVSSFQINSSSVAADGTTVRLDLLRCSSKIPVETNMGQFSYQELGMNTDVDIKEGQKVVIGRQGINRDQALFLVLTARVVQ